MTRRWTLAYATLAALHLATLAAGAHPWDSITKCLPAPLLAVWVWRSDGPRLLALAMALCLTGDFFLEIPATFIVGMLGFAGAHVCLIAVMKGSGRLRAGRWAAGVPLAAVAMVAWVWGGLEPALRVPVLVYSALLATMAALATGRGRRVGAGGLLFLFSDGLIAARLAHRLPAHSTVGGLVVMATYLAAIWLLATGLAARSAVGSRVA